MTDTKWILGPRDGDHAVVAIWGRAFPGGVTPSDANWIGIDVKVRAGRSLRFSTFLRCKDVARFGAELAKLLAGTATEARLHPRDPWLTATVTASGSTWTLSCSAREHASVRADEFAVECAREDLEQLAADVQGVAAEYPVL